ncbi:Spy/CpxP family protein refolding chaperone [Candidatus Omnitrophota bacterium]
MNRKLIVFPLLVVFLMFSVVPYIAQADGYKGKGGYHKGLDEKIFYKAKFMLKNEDELELSDKQVDKIKEIKFATKRELVTKSAEIGLVKIDIKEKLHEDKVNVAGINPLIDKKYELKKEKAKYLVKQYAALKGVLTDKQLDEMKGLWRKSCKKCKK